MKKIIEYLEDDPAALYYIALASGLIVPVIVMLIVYALRGGA